VWRGNLVDGRVYVLQGVCVLQGDGDSGIVVPPVTSISIPERKNQKKN
jgi:hypothetical protein